MTLHHDYLEVAYSLRGIALVAPPFMMDFSDEGQGSHRRPETP